jgi:hypothetical protein
MPQLLILSVRQETMDQIRTTLARGWKAAVKSLEILLRVHRSFDGSTEAGKKEEENLVARLEQAKLELKKYADE